MSQRILVVEDEVVIRRGITEFLAFQGYKVIDTDNGYEAVKLARKYQPDVILCDINLLQADGYRVLATLQADRELANIPFIFLTAMAERSDLRLGMELGADDYITKPFTLEELLQSVKTQLRKRATTVSLYHQEIQKLHGLALQTN